MTLLEIYDIYHILPFLREHQLRVGAVSQILCEHLQLEDARNIVTACLLHDMGNLLKFDMETFPDAFEPEGVKYWKGLQEEMRAKFGSDEHHATVAIAREIGVSERIVHIIDHVGYGMIPKLIEEDDLSCMIAEYSDLRVAPYGVVSMEERLEDGRRRYADKVQNVDPVWHAAMQASVPMLQERVFRDATIRPEDITSEAVAARIDVLKNWVL